MRRRLLVLAVLCACNEDLSLPPVPTPTGNGGCNTDQDCAKGICNPDHICDANGCRTDMQCSPGICISNACDPSACHMNSDCASGVCVISNPSQPGQCGIVQCPPTADCAAG